MYDMIEQFKKFEEEKGLLTDRVADFYYWVYVRFNVYMKLEEIANRQVKLTVKKNHIQIQDLFFLIRNLTYNNPLLYNENRDILFFTHARRTFDNGKYVCLYTDKIAEQLKETAVSAEFLYGTKHLRPYYTENLLELDCVDVYPVIFLKLFGKLYKKRYKRELTQFKNIAQRLDEDIFKEFGITAGVKFYYELLTRRFFWYKIKKKMLRRIIKSISPKVIVEVVGYETNKMIINEIAHEMGISTIELQHGVIGRGHIAYNYLINREYRHLPEYIFYYSDYWKHTCDYPVAKTKQIVTGYPYMEEQMRKNKSCQWKSKNMKVLILSQPEFSVKLRSLIEDVLKQFQHIACNIEFIYKLHPAEYSLPIETWKELLKYNNVKLVHDGSKSLYSLFAESDIQVGVTSTAVFEGLAYHLTTFIYHLEKTDIYMKDLKETESAIFFDTAFELVKLILETHKRTEREMNLENKFFVKNSLNNIVHEIQKVVDQR